MLFVVVKEKEMKPLEEKLFEAILGVVLYWDATRRDKARKQQ
jgi:2-keto-4-pentenoate hydratase/2-oxohepta-3-ene-1,7-dioic acid hydratase in catechol pathway